MTKTNRIAGGDRYEPLDLDKLLRDLELRHIYPDSDDKRLSLA